MSEERLPYTIEGREVVHETRDLRVQVLTIRPGQEVPWHHHTAVQDSFFCLEGSVQVETREPEAVHRLLVGERTAVPPGQPHRVSCADDSRCRFVIVQGVGSYDFVPER